MKIFYLILIILFDYCKGPMKILGVSLRTGGPGPNVFGFDPLRPEDRGPTILNSSNIYFYNISTDY